MLFWMQICPTWLGIQLQPFCPDLYRVWDRYRWKSKWPMKLLIGGCVREQLCWASLLLDITNFAGILLLTLVEVELSSPSAVFQPLCKKHLEAASSRCWRKSCQKGHYFGLTNQEMFESPAQRDILDSIASQISGKLQSNGRDWKISLLVTGSTRSVVHWALSPWNHGKSSEVIWVHSGNRPPLLRVNWKPMCILTVTIPDWLALVAFPESSEVPPFHIPMWCLVMSTWTVAWIGLSSSCDSAPIVQRTKTFFFHFIWFTIYKVKLCIWRKSMLCRWSINNNLLISSASLRMVEWRPTDN